MGSDASHSVNLYGHQMEYVAAECPERGSKEYMKMLGLDPKDYFTRGFFSTPYYTMLNMLLRGARKYAFDNKFTESKFNRFIVNSLHYLTAGHPDEYEPVERYYERYWNASSADIMHTG